MRELQAIRRSIKKRYRKTIWKPFIRALKDFKLIEENDKIAVGFSGGKDSILLSLLFKELQSYSEVKFDLCFISIDPGIKQEDGTPTPSSVKLNKLAGELDIDLKVYESNMFDFVKEANPKSPCFLCSKMRRGFLYEKCRQNGANKLALGHHMDDVAETILMNLFYQGKYMTMMPRIKSKNFENIELIRPMYYVEETEIKKWVRGAQIECFSEVCPLKDEALGARMEMKALIEELSLKIPNLKKNIERSAHHVCIDAIVGINRDIDDERTNELTEIENLNEMHNVEIEDNKNCSCDQYNDKCKE